MANLAEFGNQVACGACVMNPLCHSKASAHGAATLVDTRRRIAAGEPIYAAGAPREAVYALRAGMAQVSIDAGPGSARHIVRFLLPGDAAGLDAFAGGRHASEAVAVEDTEVCVIPTYRAELLGRYSEATCSVLRRLLSEQLARDEAHAFMLARLTAQQRVAAFLVDLSDRWAARGYSSTSFGLPMGRRAIGQHLALTTETVSRVFSDMEARHWIDLPWREVRIRRLEMLRDLNAVQSVPPQPG